MVRNTSATSTYLAYIIYRQHFLLLLPITSQLPVVFKNPFVIQRLLFGSPLEEPLFLTSHFQTPLSWAQQADTYLSAANLFVKKEKETTEIHSWLSFKTSEQETCQPFQTPSFLPVRWDIWSVILLCQTSCKSIFFANKKEQNSFPQSVELRPCFLLFYS